MDGVVGKTEAEWKLSDELEGVEWEEEVEGREFVFFQVGWSRKCLPYDTVASWICIVLFDNCVVATGCCFVSAGSRLARGGLPGGGQGKGRCREAKEGMWTYTQVHW